MTQPISREHEATTIELTAISRQAGAPTDIGDGRLRRPTGKPALRLRQSDPSLVRLQLQQSAAGNLRRHAIRAIRRVGVLVSADVLAFLAAREFLRAIRDRAWLGDTVAGLAENAIPVGALAGWQFLAALLLALLVTRSFEAGDRRRDGTGLLAASALASALPLWTQVWSQGLQFVTLRYCFTVGLIWVFLSIDRQVVHHAVAQFKSKQHACRTIFVGAFDACSAAMQGPAFRGVDFVPIGVVDLQDPPAAEALGSVKNFPAILHKTKAETVVLCGYLPDNQFQSVIDPALAARCQMFSVPRAMMVGGVQPLVQWRHGQAVIELVAPTLVGRQLLLKRTIDVILAALGLIVVAPLLLAITLLVKIDSPGPVFFSQWRVGLGGKMFRILKFRTMNDGSDRQRERLVSQSIYGDGRLFKIVRDPRITRVGRFLRPTSLDELPQLINILFGHMSLVGPRPPLPSEVQLYESHHYGRFDVKPGLTGPWQVSGRNDIRNFEDVIALEAEYIRNWSIKKDIWILLKTVPVVLGGRGAH